VADLGVPPIQSGTYFVLNTNEARDVGEVTRRIHLDYGLNAFEIEEPKVTSGEKVLDCDLTLREWPIPQSATTKSSPLNESYVVLTLAKAPTRSAAMIIDRLNILNRKATGLANVEARSQAGAALLARDLDDVRSAVTWFFTEGEYMRRKADPRALAEVIAIAEDPRLVEADKTKAVALVHRSLPTMSREFKESNGITAPAQEADLSNLKKWYDTVKSQAVYDPIKGRMMCKDEAGDEKSCH
jgi:hypothetical protein